MRLLKLGADVTSIRDHRTVMLSRGNGQQITLTVRALPSSYLEDAEAEIPSPQPPPLGVSRNKRGQIDKDPATGRPIMLYDEQEIDYVRGVARARTLQTFKMIVDSLDPDEVTFEADKSKLAPAEYYAACRAEMDDMGFGLADISALMTAVAELSDLTTADLEVEERDFS